MDTRSMIIAVGDRLLRERGYNAFSFSDIAQELGIRNASIHYHFPSKADLGRAIVAEHRRQFAELLERTASDTPLARLEAFLSIYAGIHADNKICIVGSLGTDLYSVQPAIRTELQMLADEIIAWVRQLLEEGREQGFFHFDGEARTRALLVIGNLLATLQLGRLTDTMDFERVTQTILHDLTNHT